MKKPRPFFWKAFAFQLGLALLSALAIFGGEWLSEKQACETRIWNYLEVLSHESETLLMLHDNPATQKIAEENLTRLEAYCRDDYPDQITFYLIDDRENTIKSFGYVVDATHFERFEIQSVIDLPDTERKLIWGEMQTATIDQGNGNTVYAYSVQAQTILMSGCVEMRVPQSRLALLALQGIWPTAVINSSLLILCFFLLSLLIHRLVVLPVQKMGELMSQFGRNGESFQSQEVAEKIKKEFLPLQKRVEDFSPDMAKSIGMIAKISEERAASKTELEIARKIQKGMLPEPDYLEEHYEIHAELRMMNEVGGDLYDYFSLDENHLCVAIGDVSGHGVSAAMFMSSVSLSLRDNARWYKDPSKILAAINNDMAGRNPEKLFVTLFIAVLERASGKLTYANAGHNPPCLIHQEKVTPLPGEANSMIGIFPEEEYQEDSLVLSPGDSLFLYTDGVVESCNVQKEFYGLERLQTVLSKGYSDKKIRDAVNDDLNAFIGEAVIRDDITMLTLTENTHKEFHLPIALSSIEQVKKCLRGLPGTKEEDRLALCLIAEEVLTNIISYGYPKGADEKNGIEAIIDASTEGCVLTFIDDGIPFDPRVKASSVKKYNPVAQIGGAGRILIAKNSDETDYEYKNGKNRFTVKKAWKKKRRKTK